VGATQAVHTDLKEELCGIYVVVKNIADKAVFCNNHFIDPFIENSLTE
jgi:hypothetical protein